jgi:hypothetical protein
MVDSTISRGNQLKLSHQELDLLNPVAVQEW